MQKLSIILLSIIFTTQLAYAAPEFFHASLNPSIVEFQIIDPLSNITGYDLGSRGKIENIPNTIYWIRELPGPEDIAPTKNEIYHEITRRTSAITTPILPGIYKLKVFGTNAPEKFDFFITVEYLSLKFNGIGEKQGIIYPNMIWIYEIDIPANPPANGKLTLIKVSTPQDLIIDINAAGSLGYIGNPKFVSELTKEINEIEAEKAKGKVDDDLTPAQKAKKEYTELLKEITEKYNKPESDEFVKQEAYSVLKEDLEYIISHLQ